MSLFPSTPPHIPLAERLRPQQISEVVGQSHLLGPEQALGLAFAAGQAHSMIFWGPPGVGKTTLARLCADAFGAHFIALSAVLAGVKEIRAAVEEAQTVIAQQGRPSILFIDEIHRFNKSQQDALLPFVESGLVTFIGATTENPSFEVNSALLSRAQVYVLQALQDDELKLLVERARAAMPDSPPLTPEALTFLIASADGDGRRLLNVCEQVFSAATQAQVKVIELTWLQSVMGAQSRRFDKGGDQFYDQISALHKSVRGSNPDAALYWLCRMLDGGVDPKYLARRLIRMAWEDIGLADPRALQIANDAALTYERLGSPEGELALGEAAIYLAVAPKSNAAYQAFNQAMAYVKSHGSAEVPLHLRNAPTQLMSELGHGHNYRYAHDEAHAYAAGEKYLPDSMSEPHWYQPTERGLEGKIAEKMAFLRELDAQYLKKSQKS